MRDGRRSRRDLIDCLSVRSIGGWGWPVTPLQLDPALQFTV
jgi:hypothetical protein